MEKNKNKKTNYIRKEDLFFEEYKPNLNDMSKKDIGIRTKDMRNSFDWNTKEMANKLGVSVKGLHSIEQGKSYPTSEILIRLEKMGIDITWLLYGAHTPHMDILSGLSATTDNVRFDIFIKLHDYFHFKKSIDSEISENELNLNSFSSSKHETISDRLWSLRDNSKFTLDVMSKKLFLSYSGYRKLEMGNALPNGQTLFLLHDIFGVDIYWLLMGRCATHSFLMNSLAKEEDREKFDIYVRLYSYFSTKKLTALVPFCETCDGVKHFANWNNEQHCYYKK